MFDDVRATQTRPRFYVPSKRRGVTLVSNAQIHTLKNLGRSEVRTRALWCGSLALYHLSYCIEKQLLFLFCGRTITMSNVVVYCNCFPLSSRVFSTFMICTIVSVTQWLGAFLALGGLGTRA